MSDQKSSAGFNAFLLCGLCLLFICNITLAQTSTATIRGTLLDQQGRAVPGVRVTLIDPEKNIGRSQTTDSSGSYVFNAVPPGKYQIEAEAPGFKKSTVNDVSAQVETPLDIDIQLEAGDINETVSVAASTEAPINTTDATTGHTFEEERIKELPLNARDIVNLLSLQPGVTQQGEVNGGRRDQSNITLDGIDVNEQQTGLNPVSAIANDPNTNIGIDPNSSAEAFTSVLRTTPDSTQEFRVTTSVPNANQGRSSGAQVSLVTKSGTNTFHGSLYEYHRNTATTANDFFNNALGRFTAEDLPVQLGLNQVGDLRVPRPKLIRNIFGGSLGGPIVKDRFFFFYNYEGRRDASEQSVLRTVPTATLRQGIVRYQSDNGSIVTLTPADIAQLYPGTGGVNPAGLALLQGAPLPNSFETGDKLNTAGFRFNAKTPVELNTHITRLDFNLTDRQIVFFRGNYQADDYGLPSAFPGTPIPSIWLHPYGFAAGHTWTISNNLVNNFRAGLTRQALSFQGDSQENSVSFRFVYQPLLYQRSFSRTTPVWNLTDDLSWIKGSHTLQLGTNIRTVRNHRISQSNSFDDAQINPSFFDQSGAVLTAPLTDVVDDFDTRSAIAAVLGRYSQYSVRAIYDLNGQPLAVGTPTNRTFATEEYEFYGQDSWRIRPNLTLTYGLRWGVGTPVYETGGFQARPLLSLGQFFEQRQAGAFNGQPVNELLTVDLAGKANNRPGYYQTDWNNFAPLVAVAWSPDFGDNFFGRAFGRHGRSVIRGGFRIVYDHIGNALASTFDLNADLGFASTTTISANTFDLSANVGPLLTGLGQNVRNLPIIGAPNPISFPLTVPADEATRIEQSIDGTLVTPVQYTWNFSYARELPKGFTVEMSYVGRAGRHLLISRDAMQFNNLRDPTSGQDWYAAAGVLADDRDRNLGLADVRPIPFFENLFPGLGENLWGDPALTPTQAAYAIVAKQDFEGFNFFNVNDWTLVQLVLDDLSPVAGPNAFIHPQYATLAMFSTVGSADYHGGSISIRQRFKDDILFDFNYTLSKSIDDASTLEAGDVLQNLTRQPFDLKAQRAVSDFDVRHNINANWLIGLPFGRGKPFLKDMPTVPNALLGGWLLTGVFRYHSGLPAGAVSDVGRWATNWELTSHSVRTGPVTSDNNPNVADPGDNAGRPNIFNDPLAAYRSFRNARAGEAGERNTLRIPSYVVLDLGLSKAFKLWYSEKQRLQFRWEVFNVTNTQRFGVLSNLSVNQDPNDPSSEGPAPDFGRYIGSQLPVGETRSGRVMQFALRYIF